MGMCMMYLEKFLMQVEIDLVDCLINNKIGSFWFQKKILLFFFHYL